MEGEQSEKRVKPDPEGRTASGSGSGPRSKENFDKDARGFRNYTNAELAKLKQGDLQANIQSLGGQSRRCLIFPFVG